MSREATVRESFTGQAHYCGILGSPFMQQLLLVLSERLDRQSSIGARVLDWPGDPRGAADALPLRLAAGLHALVLQGTDSSLTAAYPPNPVPDDLLWQAVRAALERHEAHLHGWLDRAPQTNEVRRSAALIAAGHLLADIYPMPLVLSELGSSAGLNLLWDHYALDLGNVRLGPNSPS